MSSIDRELHADVLRFDLDAEEENATRPDTLDRDGRSGRTLLKEGPLRVTLVVLAPGGGIPEHEARGGPITIQPLRGRVEATVAGADHTVGPGELLAVDRAVPYAMRSEDGAAFLLTVIYPVDDDD
jgi:quercetin dioxygenase-like cupin family protein